MEEASFSVLLGSTRDWFSFLFLSFSAIFFLFSLLLLLLRSRPCCTCELCRAYLNSTWADDFDNLSDWYTHLLRRSPSATIHIHVLDNTITANPDNVEYMLKTNFDNFPKGRPFSSILGDLLGRGIFNADGDLWRFQRKLASLELGSLSVRSFAHDIVSGEICHRLLPLLSSVTEVDLQDIFRRFTFDSICKISFGLDPGCLELSLPMSQFAAAFDRATMLSAQRAAAPVPALWKAKRMLTFGSERELRRAIRMVDELAGEVIRQRRKLGFASHHDLLSRFMSSVDDDRYLRDIVVSFLLAGRDTVASGLTTFFLLLSRYPEAVTAIRAEIDGAASGDASDCSKLRELHYVHAAIYESMRLYPPVQFDSKFCLDDDVLADGTFVRKNTRVTYHPYAMGRMERIWGSDCLEFRPERWLSGGVFTPANPFKYPVFQGGLRVCLGKEMAVMEMKAVIVAILADFDIEVIGGGGERPRFAPGLTASLAGGLPVRVRRRKEVSG
ncbi:Cytochrome P450 94A1 [Apostasia shenzhenica]|uniref:noroxomaritidine synthase n=1 Tax=Apostasia shenzhenica TaxID=1088818 RepID=A0A2I0B3L0_9ASPA|nr:Cytochrome P450 94A1 [Apostasia shenzhenica]